MSNVSQRSKAFKNKTFIIIFLIQFFFSMEKTSKPTRKRKGSSGRLPPMKRPKKEEMNGIFTGWVLHGSNLVVYHAGSLFAKTEISILSENGEIVILSLSLIRSSDLPGPGTFVSIRNGELRVVPDSDPPPEKFSGLKELLAKKREEAKKKKEKKEKEKLEPPPLSEWDKLKKRTQSDLRIRGWWKTSAKRLRCPIGPTVPPPPPLPQDQLQIIRVDQAEEDQPKKKEPKKKEPKKKEAKKKSDDRTLCRSVKRTFNEEWIEKIDQLVLNTHQAKMKALLLWNEVPKDSRIEESVKEAFRAVCGHPSKYSQAMKDLGIVSVRTSDPFNCAINDLIRELTVWSCFVFFFERWS
jgi:hypothetical protein